MSEKIFILEPVLACHSFRFDPLHNLVDVVQHVERLHREIVLHALHPCERNLKNFKLQTAEESMKALTE